MAWRLAQRALRSGLTGFRIFFASIVLGVMAIATVGQLSTAFLTGLDEQGRVLLGGDVAVNLVHREVDAAERAFLDKSGAVSQISTMRAMAVAMRGEMRAERQLVELKAVDAAYPLTGAVELSQNITLQTALACGGDVCGAVVERGLLARLQVDIGDRLRIGAQDFVIRAVLAAEPDRISGGFSLGPRAMISGAALARTGLIQPGSLIDYSYRLVLRDGMTPEAFRKAAEAGFADAGWAIRDRSRAAPGTSNFIAQIGMFLTLVGLTVLVVGGVGAGQAIEAFLDRKRGEFAVLKALGADGQIVFFAIFFQVMVIAALAVVLGLMIGAALPFLIGYGLADIMPLPAQYAIYPLPLILAALFGLFSAAGFSIPLLARAREIPPASLFRDQITPSPLHGRWIYRFAALFCALAILILAMIWAPRPLFAAQFLGGIVVALVLLRLIAEIVRRVLARLPQPKSALLRLALGNLTRPGAAMAGVVTALGLGLSLLATVTLLERSISAQVEGNLPSSAPSFFFVDIQPGDAEAFDRIVRAVPSAEDYRRTPMVRGRITSLKGVPSREAKVESGARWALNGDRGITYAATPPPGTDMAQGTWWDADYRGETLISFDAELAAGMGLKIGDRLTLNVLGREIEGRIHNLRHVNFSNGRQNFILVLSPGVIDKAPHTFLATVRVDDADEAALFRSVTDAFPNISAVQVKQAIAEVNGLLQQLSLGVRAASVLTILAGLLVLGGAIAAGQRARLYEATVLKVLGATRRRIAAITAVEFGLLGVVTGCLALLIGTLAAALLTRHVFAIPFMFDAGAAMVTVLGGAVITLMMGLFGAWRALAARPARQLRNP